jgi:hypothetical protein
MRRFAIAAAFGIYVFSLSCALHATGNVLLPSNSDSSSLPNLGLMPEESTSGDTANSVPAKDSSQSKDKAALPNLDSMPAITKPPSTPEMNTNYTPAPPPPSNGPHIVQMPDAQAFSDSSQANLPNSLNVALAEHNQWGARDMQSIQSQLGIPADQIGHHCHLSLSGLLTTDKNVYEFDMGSTALHAATRYDGDPTNVSIRVAALCDMLPLPETASFVFQVGDKYSVFLSQISCDKLSANKQRLIFHYEGNGNGECQL